MWFSIIFPPHLLPLGGDEGFCIEVPHLLPPGGGVVLTHLFYLLLANTKPDPNPNTKPDPNPNTNPDPNPNTKSDLNPNHNPYPTSQKYWGCQLFSATPPP